MWFVGLWGYWAGVRGAWRSHGVRGWLRCNGSMMKLRVVVCSVLFSRFASLR